MLETLVANSERVMVVEREGYRLVTLWESWRRGEAVSFEAS